MGRCGASPKVLVKLTRRAALQAPGFPSNYSVDSYCAISVNSSSAVPIHVEEFRTEPGFDPRLMLLTHSFQLAVGRMRKIENHKASSWFPAPHSNPAAVQDQMLMNCDSFSGNRSPEGIVPFTDIMWVSDGACRCKGLEDMPQRPMSMSRTRRVTENLWWIFLHRYSSCFN